MDNVIETLSISLSLLALFLIVIVVVFNLYLIKRNGFYITVNCWFCNNCTKVLYKNRNRFDCPFCLQYNGFNEDGGYNKIIKAQHYTVFKKSNNTKHSDPTNGLCNYCNNNQQLKIRQLANFVPLNENNYDVEVEHFRIQLEKSYKLCKKCEKILSTTIERQHAWIFGIRLKEIKKQGLSFIDLNKSSQGISKEAKQSFLLNLIRYLLILFSILILCQTLNIKIQYPTVEVKKIVPDIFVPYTMLINDFYSVVTRTLSDDINSINMLLPKNLKFKSNNILSISYVGFLLEIIFAVWGPQKTCWKLNQVMGWFVLVITSSFSFHDRCFVYVNTVQVLCSVIIIYSCLSAKTFLKKKQHMKKKYEFRKLRKNMENASDISDTEDFLTSSSTSSSKRSKSNSLRSKEDLSHFRCQSPCACSLKEGFKYENNVQNAGNLNESFNTARSSNSATIFNTYKNISSDSSSNELHHSLDNLHLSNLNYRTHICTSPNFSNFSTQTANRPILSPPKLKNITQNSWTAGGFWKNDGAVFPASTEFTNLSRSSSQTSGFVSNHDPIDVNPFLSLSTTREPSTCHDYDRTSVLSEPSYHFKPISTVGLNASQLKNGILYNLPQPPKLQPTTRQLFYRNDNVFYPVLNQHNMLFIPGNDMSSHKFETGFNNLSSKNFSTNSNNFSSRFILTERPIVSSLFKNLPKMDSAVQSCGMSPC